MVRAYLRGTHLASRLASVDGYVGEASLHTS